MRRPVKSVVGIVIGIVALVAIACSQTPSAPTSSPVESSGGSAPVVQEPITPPRSETVSPPISSGSPISILDTINPDECSFVHNINACFVDGQPPTDISLGEIMEVFFIARDDLSESNSLEPISIKIKTIERVEWNDSSLGNPQPGQVYSQVITPGFKMVLQADSQDYVYHTSTDRAVFVNAE